MFYFERDQTLGGPLQEDGVVQVAEVRAYDLNWGAIERSRHVDRKGSVVPISIG